MNTTETTATETSSGKLDYQAARDIARRTIAVKELIAVCRKIGRDNVHLHAALGELGQAQVKAIEKTDSVTIAFALDLVADDKNLGWITP